MEKLKQMKLEMKEHLEQVIIPFWKSLRDDEFGGYYGFVDQDLKVDKTYVKGCILNSRITWFFSNAYKVLGDASLLEEAKHGYEFLRDHCIDKENGGVYWTMTYDGKPDDTMKHTYNQAFAIYALSSYYGASGDEEALELAKGLFDVIEIKCKDEVGYMEAFNRVFEVIRNDATSENGIIADKTMNTLLHVFEAYTELYRVSGWEPAKERLHWILDEFADRVYNPKLHRQEVFFDAKMNTLIDLHSYGHDIETAWLIDRCLDVLQDSAYTDKITPITRDLTNQIYQVAFDGHSLANECEKGVVDQTRIWWVQAETVVGFVNGYQHTPEREEYLEGAYHTWQFIKKYLVDKRPGSEWFPEVTSEGKNASDKPMVEPWKCPYHNGRMCLEMLQR